MFVTIHKQSHALSHLSIIYIYVDLCRVVFSLFSILLVILRMAKFQKFISLAVRDGSGENQSRFFSSLSVHDHFVITFSLFFILV